MVVTHAWGFVDLEAAQNLTIVMEFSLKSQ